MPKEWIKTDVGADWNVIENPLYLFGGDFEKGTAPTLLEATEAQIVVRFIRAIMGGRAVIQTGNVKENSARITFGDSQAVLDLWIKTSLQSDSDPWLSSALNLNGYSVIFNQGGTQFVQYGGEGLVIRGAAGEAGAIRLLPMDTGNNAKGMGFVANNNWTEADGELLWVLPNGDGTGGQFLKTDGSKNLSWGTAGGGGTYSWTAADEHGNDQEVGDGGIVTIFGDDFIDCTLTTGGSDPYWSLSLDATGTADATTFLRGDNTWSEPVGAFDFDVKGDSGGPTTVGSGDIIGVAGGYGPIITRLLTVVNGTTTQQFLIDHEESADPAIGGAYTNADITIDDYGHVTVAANGSTSGYEFDLDGDSGPTQTISDGNTVTLAGGNGLDSVASADDTVTFAIDDTVAQKCELSGNYLGDEIVEFATNDSANTFGLIGGANVVLVGDQTFGTVGIHVDITEDVYWTAGTDQVEHSYPIINNKETLWFKGLGPITTQSYNNSDDFIEIFLEDTAVIPGSYSAADITVDAQGRITSASDSATGCAPLPYSDHPYASGSDESWEYEICGAPAIEVTFDSDTEVVADTDYIHIHYWDSFYSWEPITGSPFTGTELASATKRLSGSKVKIRLDSSVSGGGEYGFNVTSIVSHQPGIISFDLDGDSGPTQTVEDGNTVTLAGGTAITTVASATDTVTLNLDDTAVSAGSYSSADITVDAQGRLTYAAGGTAKAPIDAQYVVLTADGDLTDERVLTAGAGITITDAGAGSTVTIAAPGGSGTVTSVATSNGTFVDVTGGTITTTGTITGDLSATGTASGTTFLRGDNTWAVPAGGGGGAPTDASYVVLGSDSTLTDERVLTAGSNITITDGGAGGNVTIAASGGGGSEATTLDSGTSYTSTATTNHIYILNIPDLSETFTLTMPMASGIGGVRLTFVIRNSNYEAFKVKSNSTDRGIYDFYEITYGGGGVVPSLETNYEWIAWTVISEGSSGTTDVSAWYSDSYNEGYWYA